MSRDIELEQQIDAYVKGKLSEEEAQKLWEKLLKHPEYIEFLNTELGVKSIIEGEPSLNYEDDIDDVEEKGIVYSIKKYRNWIAAAAAVTILVVSVNILQVDTNQTLKQSAIQDINITENLASAQILRSQKSELPPADSLLNRGFEAAISGEISKALEMYNQIIEKYGNGPAAVQAYLNKGIIQYNTGDFKKSIVSFDKVLENVKEKPVAKEKAYWYMGNAYINTDQLEEARNAIHNAYSMDGIYRKPAFRLLRKLDYEMGNIDYDNFDQQLKNN